MRIYQLLVKKASNKVMIGTSKQGTIHIGFDALVDMFGTPHYLFESEPNVPPNRVRCEWDITIDGEPVAVYDWCQYDNEIEDVKEWNIGGHSVRAVQKLMELKGAPMDTLKVVIDMSKFQ